jgi:hypothetical protein
MGRADTTLRTCKYCRKRIIFPRTAENKGLPPVDFTPDPAGPIAAYQHTPGQWIGRFLAKKEDALPHEKRYHQHWCTGLERQKQRGQWTAANTRLARQRRNGRGRRRPGPDPQPGMFRLPTDPPDRD